MKRFLLVALISFAVVAAADDDPSFDDSESFLAIGHIAGMCHTLNRLTHFQRELRMPGSADFVHRFLSVEAVKSGYSSADELHNFCERAVALYNLAAPDDWAEAEQ